MSDRLRIAMLGAGPSAVRFHFSSLIEMADVEMVAVCDVSAERRETVAKDFRIPRQYENYCEMLKRESPDAVYVVMFPQHLDPIVRDCLERGVNVFTEKPPGMNAAQTRGWAELAAKKSLLTMVGFNRRFAPLIVELRKRVEQRGPARNVLIEFYKRGKADPMEQAHPGYDFLTQGSHHVDLLRWFAGEPTDVCAFPDHHYADYQNVVTCAMKFPGGATGVLVFHRGGGVKRLERIVVHGDQVTGILNDTNVGGIVAIQGNETELRRADVVTGTGYHHEFGYFQENRHFMDCLRNRALPQTNFADATKTMELVERVSQMR